MYRGTTPALAFKLPFQASELAEAWITIAQMGRSAIKRTLDECIIDGDTLIIELSQEETLALRSGHATEAQIRARKTTGEALASNIMPVDVNRILEEGVI